MQMGNCTRHNGVYLDLVEKPKLSTTINSTMVKSEIIKKNELIIYNTKTTRIMHIFIDSTRTVSLVPPCPCTSKCVIQ